MGYFVLIPRKVIVPSPSNTEEGYHLFRKEYVRTCKDLSCFLVFIKKCLVYFGRVVRDFDRHSFWTSILLVVTIAQTVKSGAPEPYRTTQESY
jgi:hypothetical protein